MEGGEGGEMAGGHQRAVWEQQKVHWFPLLSKPNNWSDLADEGGGMGGGTREQCGSNKS